MKTTTERELEIAMDVGAELEARKGALAQIAKLGDLDAVPPLAVLMTEIEEHLIPDVKRTLSALGASEVLALGLAERPIEERVHNVRLLGYLEDDSAIPALLGALEDRDGRVRAQAADAMIRLCPSSVVRPLEQRLFEDRDPEVRMAAAQALGEIADEVSIAALRRAMETESDGFVHVIVELSFRRAERIREDRTFWS